MPHDPRRRSPPPTTPQAGECGERTRVVHSEALFDGAGLVVVRHRGESYRLRQTRLGKLILTK